MTTTDTKLRNIVRPNMKDVLTPVQTVPTTSVPYTGEVILISQKCWPSARASVPRTATVPQL